MNVQLFIKYFRVILTLNRDIYSNIAIIIILDFIYNNFNILIFNFLEISNKLID